MTKHLDQNKLVGERVNLAYCPDHSPSLRDAKAGTRAQQDLKAGTEAEAVEELCFLACSAQFAQPAFLYNLGSPGPGWHHPQQPRARSHVSVIQRQEAKLQEDKTIKKNDITRQNKLLVSDPTEVEIYELPNKEFKKQPL